MASKSRELGKYLAPPESSEPEASLDDLSVQQDGGKRHTRPANVYDAVAGKSAALLLDRHTGLTMQAKVV
jgi:hypothetical protein